MNPFKIDSDDEILEATRMAECQGDSADQQESISQWSIQLRASVRNTNSNRPARRVVVPVRGPKTALGSRERSLPRLGKEDRAIVPSVCPEQPLSCSSPVVGRGLLRPPSAKEIHVLVVEDLLALRIGLAGMLSPNPNVRVVAEVVDSVSALAACAEHKPDVVLMDLRIPGSGAVDATLAIRKRWPATRVLIIATFDLIEDVYRVIKAGASGYLPLKDLSSAELVKSIEVTVQGGTVIAPDLALRLRRRARLKDLSPREFEILGLIVDGRRNKEIAGDLHLAEETVKSYLKTLFHKLNVADRTQAAVEAIRHGIVRLSMDPAIRENAQSGPAVAESAPPFVSPTISPSKRGQQGSLNSKNQAAQKNIRLLQSPHVPSNACSSPALLSIAVGY